MTDKYILKEHEAVQEPSLLKWGSWFETADRIVAKDKIGDVLVSTVFLGLDHSFGSGPPLIFETMVFGGEHNEDMDRYSTWDEAVRGHNNILNKVRKNK